MLGEEKSNIDEFYSAHWQADGYGTDQSDVFQRKIFRKMFPGYEDQVRTLVRDFDRVLDAGCGDGTAAMAFFGKVWDKIYYTGLEPSGVAPAYNNLRRMGRQANARILNRSIFDAGFEDNHFDWVFCTGVLHYLDDMEKGLAQLVRMLKPGGTLVLWVYQRQKPIRELTDQYLRSYYSAMSPENAKKAIVGLTDLGISLGGIYEKLFIQRDVPELGIEAGVYTVQEFFYYYIMKLFFNKDLSFERHVVNNWNAFYPSPVTFIDPGRLRDLLVALRLEVDTWNDEGNGIAVMAMKVP